jgi:hypothetical protein
MNPADYKSDCQPLVGQTLRSVEKKDYSWFFVFADDISIVTESTWRLLSEDGIIVTSEDHGHQFGLPAPVDAAERVLAGVSRKAVVIASPHEDHLHSHSVSILLGCREGPRRPALGTCQYF